MTDVADLAEGHERFRRELAIRAARIGAGELAQPAGFGLCDVCADPIEAERRAILPGARRCIHCQEAWEAGLRNLSR